MSKASEWAKGMAERPRWKGGDGSHAAAQEGGGVLFSGIMGMAGICPGDIPSLIQWLRETFEEREGERCVGSFTAHETGPHIYDPATGKVVKA